MPISRAALVLCDFGAAVLGEPHQRHSGDVMPGVYRAPEIILGLDWDSKIDMWSVGVMVCTYNGIHVNHLTCVGMGFI